MFRRARIRLTALYVVLFAVVIAVFSVVFYVGFLIVLPPAFDLAPDLTSEQVAAVAYQTTVERIGVALLGADVVVIAAVAVAAWVLAARTLEPIREAHARQRRFVADASHEMRTPLAAILSSAEGAIATARTPDELRQALDVDARAARSLAAITNDLCCSPGATSFPRIAENRSTCRSSSPRRSRRSPGSIRSSRRSGCRSARICVCPPIQPRSVGSSRTFSIMRCATGPGRVPARSRSRHAPSIAMQSSRSATTDLDSWRTTSSASSSRSTESTRKSRQPRGAVSGLRSHGASLSGMEAA